MKSWNTSATYTGGVAEDSSVIAQRLPFAHPEDQRQRDADTALLRKLSMATEHLGGFGTNELLQGTQVSEGRTKCQPHGASPLPPGPLPSLCLPEGCLEVMARACLQLCSAATASSLGCTNPGFA